MPAAAVIPAPIAYIKVVAVKKLVVGFRDVTIRRVRPSKGARVKRPRAVRASCGRRLRARSVVRARVRVRARGVSTGLPVPSFWIPVPAIELVGTSQGARRRRASAGGGSLGPRSFTVKKLECSKQADQILCHRIH